MFMHLSIQRRRRKKCVSTSCIIGFWFLNEDAESCFCSKGTRVVYNVYEDCTFFNMFSWELD